MTKSTITRERLLEIIVTGPEASGAEQNELARMALAAMDSEPVILYRERNPYNGLTTGWQELTENEFSFIKENAGENAEFLTLYRHAQPAHELKPVGYLFVSDQGAIAYSPTDWWVPGFRLAGQIFGDIDVELKPAPVVLKDHGIRELVNQLRDIAIEYHGTQQLRERIALVIRAVMLNGGKP